MFSTGSPTDALEFLMIGTGVVFLLKRLADMDKYYEVRLFVITLILSLAAIIIFIGFGLSFVDPVSAECPEYHYCQTEM